MPQFQALKRSAGRHNFVEGQVLDLPNDEAKELLADGAITPVSRSAQKALVDGKSNTTKSDDKTKSRQSKSDD